MEEKFNYYRCYRRTYFNEYHSEYYYIDGAKSEQILSINSGVVEIKSMWRMQVLGEIYGVNISDYEDDTNHELYDEMLWSCTTDEEKEYVDRKYCFSDSFEWYYERLAEVASSVGCERMEIKCLIKALIIEFNKGRISWTSIQDDFEKIYKRLAASKNSDYRRAANKLAEYYYSKSKD